MSSYILFNLGHVTCCLGKLNTSDDDRAIYEWSKVILGL